MLPTDNLQPPTPYPRPTWLEIDLAALTGNVQALRQMIGPERQLFAVVKANGYGHGATLIGPAALAAGADRLAVATLGEAVALRRVGVTAPILLLGYPPDYLGPELLAWNLDATLFDSQTAAAWSATGQAAGRQIRVHVKVDTGMHRLGLAPEDGGAFLSLLAGLPGLEVEGIYTHFSTADETDPRYALLQLSRFQGLLCALGAAGLRPPLAHAANSAAILSLPASHLDGARAGIALYGLHPSPQVELPPGFRPVLSWKARIAQVKRLAVGEPVSYGNRWQASRPSQVAIVPVGYADGFPRAPHTWQTLLIHGQSLPIVGRVCMDMTVVDVTALAEAGIDVQAGDEVVLIGSQGPATLSAEEAARRLETINYEVISRLMARLPRLPVGRTGSPLGSQADCQSALREGESE
ncbi:MAG: alanine racemase [Caldilineaceae bacterium]|nr:alanine racemase [Caldilineaceae bacterium]